MYQRPKEEDANPASRVQVGTRRTRAAAFREGAAPVRKPGGCYVQCLCRQASWREGRMVQCMEENCQVWQHKECAGYEMSNGATNFFCQQCRCKRADPFWEDVGVAVLPFMRLRYTGRQIASGNTLQQVQVQERAFHIRPQELGKVFRKEWRLQVVCLMLSDNVPFRYHWPKNCNLRVNNTQYRVYGRSPTNKLGNNQRDEPALIDSIVRREGTNTICIECVDSCLYAVSVQLVRHVSVNHVKLSMRREETLEAAKARVIRQVQPVGCSADDDIVETVSAVVSLKCPLSGMRINTAARFSNVNMLEAIFDLDSFLQAAERTRKWSCPHSLQPSCIQNLTRDAYMARVLDCLSLVPEVMEIEINPDGNWRPYGSDSSWRSIDDRAPVARVKVEDCYGDRNCDESEDEEEEMRQAALAMRLQKSEAQKEATRNIDVIDLLSDDSDDRPWAGIQPDTPLNETDARARNDCCATDPSVHQVCTSRTPVEMHSIRYNTSQPTENGPRALHVPKNPKFLSRFPHPGQVSRLPYPASAHMQENPCHPGTPPGMPVGAGVQFGIHGLTKEFGLQHPLAPLVPCTAVSARPTMGQVNPVATHPQAFVSHMEGIRPVSGQFGQAPQMRPAYFSSLGLVGHGQNAVPNNPPEMCYGALRNYTQDAQMNIKEVTLKASDILRKGIPRQCHPQVEIIELDMDD